MRVGTPSRAARTRPGTSGRSRTHPGVSANLRARVRPVLQRRRSLTRPGTSSLSHWTPTRSLSEDELVPGQVEPGSDLVHAKPLLTEASTRPGTRCGHLRRPAVSGRSHVACHVSAIYSPRDE